MKRLSALILLVLATSSYAEEVSKPDVGKGNGRDEIILKVVPVKPPQPLAEEQEDEFEKQLESLKRQFKLLELKLKIEKIKAEMEKIQSRALNNISPNISPGSPRSSQAIINRESQEERKFRERILQLKLRQQQQRLLSAKLSYIQNLFTGIVEVNGQRVAFDSFGRRYVTGSYVEGFRIAQILPDSIIVEGNITEGVSVTYKIPISSGLASSGKGKNKNQSEQAEGYETSELLGSPFPNSF